MGRTRVLAVITALLIVSALAVAMHTVEVAEANPFKFGPEFEILSPELFQKRIYQTSTIPIEIKIYIPIEYPNITQIYCILDLNYSLDNNIKIPLSVSNPQSSTYSGVQSISYLGTGSLEISNGTHTIDVYALNAEGEDIKSYTRIFEVNLYPTTISEQPLATGNLTTSPTANPSPTATVPEFPTANLATIFLLTTIILLITRSKEKR